MDEGGGKAVVGEERDIEVYGGTAYLISVGQLMRGEVFRDIDYHVYLLAAYHVEGLRLGFLRWPIDALAFHSIVYQIAVTAPRGI